MKLWTKTRQEFLPSDLSLRGSLKSDQDSKVGSEFDPVTVWENFEKGSRTFSPDHLNKVRSGIWGRILFNSFLRVPRYSTDSFWEWVSCWMWSPREGRDSSAFPDDVDVPCPGRSSPLVLDVIGPGEPKTQRNDFDLRSTGTKKRPRCSTDLEILSKSSCSFPYNLGRSLQCLSEKWCRILVLWIL